MFDQSTLKKIKFLQKREITDYVMYKKLAKIQKDPHNKKVIQDIAEEELGHYQFWAKVSKTEIKPSRFLILYFYFISRVFGITFGIRLMEKGEVKAQSLYQELIGKVDGLETIIEEEEKHEEELIDALDEEKLKYVGSIVLGLNDALVELTGTLAGLTFALANAQIVGFSGLITGIAASLSMASSEYLSTKQEESHSFALKSALYTGVAYIFAVIFMILPYLLMPVRDFNILGMEMPSVYLSLAITILIVVFIIFIFNYYISVAKNLNFKKRFLEMVSISLGVALLSFVVGYLVKIFFGIEV
jgi:vacuolar iron transporter family protein